MSQKDFDEQLSIFGENQMSLFNKNSDDEDNDSEYENLETPKIVICECETKIVKKALAIMKKCIPRKCLPNRIIKIEVGKDKIAFITDEHSFDCSAKVENAGKVTMPFTMLYGSLKGWYKDLITMQFSEHQAKIGFLTHTSDYISFSNSKENFDYSFIYSANPKELLNLRDSDMFEEMKKRNLVGVVEKEEERLMSRINQVTKLLERYQIDEEDIAEFVESKIYY